VGPLEFRLLGPLEVVDGDRTLALGAGQQRALFAMLLLHANEVVSADRLIDALWGAAPPATAAKTVQVYVSRLRKVLGDGRLVTLAPGYALRVERSEIDLGRFEQLVGEAARSDPERAMRTLRDALSLWRGPALADLAYESFAQPEIARLEELRWSALEQRIDVDLAAGRHADLVGELRALVAQHPLRERLRAQLMLALYRSGRQAEALSAYRQAQRELADRLGLDPSEELKRLEEAILRQDPALDAPRDEPAPMSEAPARSLLLAPQTPDSVDALVLLAEPLADGELVIAAIVDSTDVASATAALAERRGQLLAAGVATRAVAFASRAPGRDLVRLAGQERVALLVRDIAGPRLDDDVVAVLEQAPCDVALLATAGGAPRPGPALVPFGGAWHDWAALELAAWYARSTGAPLRLIGAVDASADASRLLADASLILQRTTGIVAEPLLAPPGRGVFALAEGAGLLVVGLSERWRQEGLGRVRGALVEAPPAPTVLIRRGPRPGGLAPPETITRFGWSLTA